jgi:hypothetical protein
MRPNEPPSFGQINRRTDRRLRIDHNNAVWGRRGREAFLAHQEHLFNRYSAVPHTSIGIIITSIIATCLFLFFYELLAFGASRIIKAPTSVFTER